MRELLIPIGLNTDYPGNGDPHETVDRLVEYLRVCRSVGTREDMSAVATVFSRLRTQIETAANVVVDHAE